MHIEQHNNEKNGYFQALDNGQEAGKMTYFWANEGKFVIDHTEVDDAYRGQNVGKQLVMAAVEFARAQHLKITPVCPYAKSAFARTEAIQDVLA